MDVLSKIDNNIVRYGKDTMVYRVIQQNLLTLAHRLENIERGLKRWCECVSPDLEWHGLGREGVYELIAEDYLDGRKIFHLWLLTNGAQVTVESDCDRLIVMIQDGGERYGILLREMSGKITATYANLATNTREVHWEEDYLTFICKPSFKEEA